MQVFFGMVWRGLRKIASFSGRDSLGQFWMYAGAVLGLAMASWMAVVIPTIVLSAAAMQRFAVEHPDQAEVQSGPGSYSISIEGNHPELMPDLTGLTAAMSVIMAVVVVLLASALVRRLHDRGKSGFWALPTFILLTSGMILMLNLFADIGSGKEPDIRLFTVGFLNNLAYLASLVVLIVQLVQRGSAEANRFGDPPLP
ncbi:MAG: DUF805 domain-containing protein [Pseudomonadota bacterium]